MTVGMHPARFVCARFDFDSQFWNGVDSRHFFSPLHLVKLWLSKYPNEASRSSHDTTIRPCPNQHLRSDDHKDHNGMTSGFRSRFKQSMHPQITFKKRRSLWVISCHIISHPTMVGITDAHVSISFSEIHDDPCFCPVLLQLDQHGRHLLR